jgi:hypothetical protein
VARIGGHLGQHIPKGYVYFAMAFCRRGNDQGGRTEAEGASANGAGGDRECVTAAQEKD